MAEFRHLVRIANTDLDGNKPIGHALTKISGVGPMLANAICGQGGVAKTAKTGELSDAEIRQLDAVLQNPKKFMIPDWLLNRRNDPIDGESKHLMTADLRFRVENDIKLQRRIKSYRGVRHSAGLPVRGQRTKSNFRKNKGKVSLGVKRKAGKAGRV